MPFSPSVEEEKYSACCLTAVKVVRKLRWLPAENLHEVHFIDRHLGGFALEKVYRKIPMTSASGK